MPLELATAADIALTCNTSASGHVTCILPDGCRMHVSSSFALANHHRAQATKNVDSVVLTFSESRLTQTLSVNGLVFHQVPGPRLPSVEAT